MGLLVSVYSYTGEVEEVASLLHMVVFSLYLFKMCFSRRELENLPCV